MNWSRILLKTSVFVAGLLCASAVSIADDEPEKKEPLDPDEQRVRNFPVPIDQVAKGIRVPNLSEAGKLISQFIVGSAKRVSQEKVEMEKVTMELYDEKGKTEFLVELPASVLDIRTGRISSDDPIAIKHPSFELTGEKMEFDTKTKQGRLIGAVKMVIFDVEALVQEKKHE